MPRVCQITGAHITSGSKIHRSGKAKKEGGIGKHITKTVKRKIRPNLRRGKRIWVPELNQWVTVTLSARALKTINKNGAFAVLKEAGLLKGLKPEPAKKQEAKAA
jgi:large subunit ribosomal protein L28